MGYTTYFSSKKKPAKEKFAKFLKDVKKLYKNLPAVSKSAGACYLDEPILIRDGHGKGQPIFSEEEIIFNGNESTDMSHETFVFRRSEFNEFCKTARKPYDLLVCLVLLSAQKHFGDNMEISSDGNYIDWEPAIDEYEKIMGEVPVVPKSLLF